LLQELAHQVSKVCGTDNINFVSREKFSFEEGIFPETKVYWPTKRAAQG